MFKYTESMVNASMKSWKDIGHLSRQQTRDLQNKRLRTFINQYIYPFSPFYRKLFDNTIDPRRIHTVEDLQKLPFTSKNDFRNFKTGEDHVKEFVLQPDKDKIQIFWPVTKTWSLALKAKLNGESVKDLISREFRPAFMTFTTGTTSEPIPFIYSGYDLNNLNCSGSRMFQLFGIDPSERIVNLFPFAPHLAFWQVTMAGFSTSSLILGTGGGKVMGTDGNIRIIAKIKPSVILGVPSYVYHVVRTAKEQGADFSSIRKVILGAAKVTVGFKMKLAEMLSELGARNVQIFGTYGFTEGRTAWGECPSALDVSTGYHIYPDKDIVEIIDPQTGAVKGPGEDGELVYTSIDSRGSAVIRFRTGDFVKGGIVDDPCPHCGLTVPRVSSDIVRLTDVANLQLSKIKGTLVDLNHFAEVLNDMPEVDDWQIEIRKKNNDPYDVDEIAAYICPKRGSDPNRLKEKIRQKILSATELTLNEVAFITLRDIVDRLELEKGNKDKRILDKRPKV